MEELKEQEPIKIDELNIPESFEQNAITISGSKEFIIECCKKLGG